jgi:hypothetical protein
MSIELSRHTKRPDREYREPAARRESWIYDDGYKLARSLVQPVQQRTSVEMRFEDLSFEWQRTRNPFASGIENFVLPAYQQIIGLGPEAVPFLLRALATDPDGWYWALRAITGADPVPDQHLGDLNAMRRDWYDWAANNDFVW